MAWSFCARVERLGGGAIHGVRECVLLFGPRESDFQHGAVLFDLDVFGHCFELRSIAARAMFPTVAERTSRHFHRTDSIVIE